jgi:hypothetical protein
VQAVDALRREGLNRVVASSASAYFEHEHLAQGVKIVCNTRVIRLEGASRDDMLTAWYPARRKVADFFRCSR